MRRSAKQIFKMAAMVAILDSDLNDFSYLLSHVGLILSSFESIDLLVQEKKRKIDSQDGGHLGFLIERLLARHPDTSNQVSSQLAFSFR